MIMRQRFLVVLFFRLMNGRFGLHPSFENSDDFIDGGNYKV